MQHGHTHELGGQSGIAHFIMLLRIMHNANILCCSFLSQLTFNWLQKVRQRVGREVSLSVVSVSSGPCPQVPRTQPGTQLAENPVCQMTDLLHLAMEA